MYIGTEAGNEHYSHIVIDIVKGTCEITMDPHADAQTVERSEVTTLTSQ